MSELRSVIEEVARLSQDGQPAALCTIVKTKGSTPQSSGATMLLRGDFSTMGTLGGGCVEAEVRKRAFEMLQRGESAVLDFVLDHDYGWDDGLICGGRMDVAVMTVDPARDGTAFRRALSEANSRQPTHVSLLVRENGELVEYRVHVEVPPKLLIVGAGHVGHALARLAADLEFDIKVFDDRADYATSDRFGSHVELIVDDIAAALQRFPIDSSCYVVIVTRGHQHDQQALQAVVRGNAGYIGLIGSRRKAKLIYSDLREGGVSEEQLARVRTPIGLPIGALLVPEIAVSIAAELIQVRRAVTPRRVEGPIAVGG